MRANLETNLKRQCVEFLMVGGVLRRDLNSYYSVPTCRCPEYFAKFVSTFSAPRLFFSTIVTGVLLKIFSVLFQCFVPL